MGEPYVGRLAPSPTGSLHLGHARSFLIAWWRARSQGGRVLLRVEDLDRARVRPGAVDTCLADLEWLGVDWDGAPLVQSADLAPYEEALARLIAGGHAYPCVCSRKEVHAISAPHADDRELRYPGTCRGRFADAAAARAETGREAGHRLRVPPGPVRVVDGHAGEATFDVDAEVGDFLLQRRDGVAGYQLSVVVDDARQGVTEVVRGDDLFASAARQQLVYAALGLPAPAWVHLPLVVHPGGERLAKRREDLALESLRAGGVDGRAVVAWAARSAGMAVPERLTAAEALSAFDLAAVPREPVELGPGDLARMSR